MSGSAGLSGLPVARHACPARAAEDALLLLGTGRTDMARAVLERLPGTVRDALDDAGRQARGLECAERTVLSTLRICDAAGARLEEATAEALASGRTTVGRVAGLVDVRPGDVAALASGLVGLSPGGWRRLPAAIGAGPDGDAAPVMDRVAPVTDRAVR